MRGLFRILTAGLCFALASGMAEDLSSQRLQPATALENSQVPYYWNVTPIGNTAQLVTLLCHSCLDASDQKADLPLIAVLRDTLGDENPESDRLTSVWLLTYARPSLGQRLLSAVPFFYWRVGKGSKSTSHAAPLFDLTAPRHPVAFEVSRNILQWTMLDSTVLPVRATSRAYGTNQRDHERLHLEEAISYLRRAPTGGDQAGLTQAQINTVIARLELRKSLLGGLVDQRRAARLGEESGFEEERIRSRNWELLRQCAEKTGLLFEPVDIAGKTGQYGMLWFPLGKKLRAGWYVAALRMDLAKYSQSVVRQPAERLEWTNLYSRVE